MNETTKTLLIVGGVAFAAFLIYKKATAPAATKSPIATSTAGTGNSVTTATANGSGGDANFWSTLGANGKGLNQGVSAVESTYNQIYNLFGGSSSSTPTGQGNNGAEG